MASRKENRRFGSGRLLVCTRRSVLHTHRLDEVASTVPLLRLMSLDSFGRTVIHSAVQRNDLQSVMKVMHRIPVTMRSSFVNSQTKPDSGRSGKRTALHEAALRGNARMYLALIVHGADPILRDGHGRTAFDIWTKMKYPVHKLKLALAAIGASDDGQRLF